MKKIVYISAARREFENFCAHVKLEKESPNLWRIILGFSSVGVVCVVKYAEEMGVSWAVILLGIGLCVSALISAMYTFSSKSEVPLFRQLAHFLKLNYEKGEALPWGIVAATQMGFMPQITLGGNFWMEHDGRRFDMYRGSWGERATLGNYSRGEHHGFVFSCYMHKQINHMVILVADSLLAKTLGTMHGFKRIKLEWLEFEEKFDLFSDDEKEVREVMTPDVMATLHDFYRAVGKPMCFVFEGNRFSCFYEEGPVPEDSKERLWHIFCNLYLMREFPMLLNGKVMAAAWQEKKYVQERELPFKS